MLCLISKVQGQEIISLNKESQTMSYSSSKKEIIRLSVYVDKPLEDNLIDSVKVECAEYLQYIEGGTIDSDGNVYYYTIYVGGKKYYAYELIFSSRHSYEAGECARKITKLLKSFKYNYISGL